MAPAEKNGPASIAVFLEEAAKVPLLDLEQEVALCRELRECHRELELLMLGSPVVWRQVLAWGELVRSGGFDVSMLMPRGRKTPAQVAAMRRRLLSVCRLLRYAVKKDGAARERVVSRLEDLNLNRMKLLGLIDAVRAQDPAVAEVSERIARARTALVEANIRLAVSVAKRFIYSKMEFGDLVQEGTLGLMKAADRFDERRGFKFSTYATWWIRQSIQRAILDKGATIRLPVNVSGLRDRVRLIQRGYMDRYGREATSPELAHRLGLSYKRLRAILDSAQEPISLSAESLSMGDDTMEERLPDSLQPSPLAAVKSVLRVDEVRAALGKISEREALVLRLRFGIGQDRPLTLEACGKRLGITRERVRQIEHKAIRKLQSPRLAGRLKDYWGHGQ